MNRTSILASVAFAVATVVAVACGSSDSSSSGGNCNTSASTGLSSDCLSCVESNCESQLSDESDACGGCTENGTSACTQAAGAVGMCAVNSCEAQCTVTDTTSSGSDTTSTGTAGGTVTFACTGDNGGTTSCNEFKDYPAAGEANVKAGCTAAGETISDSCSTDGLLGCCTLVATTETCFYDDGGETMADAQMACTEGNGTFSATP